MYEKIDNYQICIQEYLDLEWSDWFDGWNIEHQENGSTMLTGMVPDQAALHGVLVRIRNLNLTLVSLMRGELPNHSIEGK
jgi:hypothetical protein